MREFLEIEITRSNYSIEEIMALKQGLIFEYPNMETRMPLMGRPKSHSGEVVCFETQDYYMGISKNVPPMGTVLSIYEDLRRNKKVGEGIAVSKYYEKSKKEDFRIDTPLDSENSKTTETSLEIDPNEKEFLEYGIIPLSMDDKWFMFMEDNVIHYYRSWTGIEFFKAQLIETENGNWKINEVIVSKEAKNLSISTVELFKDLVKNQITRMKRIMG